MAKKKDETRFFKVEKDTSLPRAFRAVRDNSGTVYDYEVEGVYYDEGQVLRVDPDQNQVDPRVLERFDNGDEHLNSLLTEVGQDEYDEYVSGVKDAGQLVRAPEHSVEAYVLSSDTEEGYVVLSEAEGIELANVNWEEDAERAGELREQNSEGLPDSSDEEFPSAVDFAAAKGASDRKAGRGQGTTEFAREALEDAVDEREEVDVEAQAKQGRVAPQPNAQQTESGKVEGQPVEDE